jgi:hypothetical protein
MKSEICKREVDTRDELLARILDAAARIKKREDQLRRTTRHLRTRVAKCIEVDGGIFENLLWTVTNLSLKQQIKIKLTVLYLYYHWQCFLFVESGSSIPVTIQNQTHVHTNVFLTMTDTSTSQNIGPSSWITLYLTPAKHELWTVIVSTFLAPRGSFRTPTLSTEFRVTQFIICNSCK